MGCGGQEQAPGADVGSTGMGSEFTAPAAGPYSAGMINQNSR